MATTRIGATARWALLASATALAGFGFLRTTAPVEAKAKDEVLRYQVSYAAAFAQAKERNAVIFATFHKDN